MDKIDRYTPPTTDPWLPLQEFTQARIALGRTGSSLPTQQLLNFNMAHAHARDAVYAALEIDELTNKLKVFGQVVLPVKSMAANRVQYLQRPDLGRLLLPSSAELLLPYGEYPAHVAIIIADGLSASGINQHTVPLLNKLMPLLNSQGLILGPLCLAEQARVALADHIGHTLQAKMTIIIIGERPGLSAADSVGAYLTYDPRPALTDDARNCVSNIRPGGLSYEMGAKKIAYLVQQAFSKRLSGVGLKDEEGLIR